MSHRLPIAHGLPVSMKDQLPQVQPRLSATRFHCEAVKLVMDASSIKVRRERLHLGLRTARESASGIVNGSYLLRPRCRS